MGHLSSIVKGSKLLTLKAKSKKSRIGPFILFLTSLLISIEANNPPCKSHLLGNEHVCHILDDMTVKCWGSNWQGRVGTETFASYGDAPFEMGNFLPTINYGPGIMVAKMELGQIHTCALFSDFRSKCHGRNNYGQLGLGHVVGIGDDTNEMGNYLPFMNLGAGNELITNLGLGRSHTCAIEDWEKMKCFGQNQFGQLGYGHENNTGDQPNEMGDYLPYINLGTGRAPNYGCGGDHTVILLSLLVII